jgi:site-specific recombinase XerD
MIAYKNNSSLENMDNVDIISVDANFMNSIKISDLNKYLDWITYEKNNGTTSRCRKIASIKSFFKFLHVQIEVIEKNPADKLESPKINQKEVVALNYEQSYNLLEKSKTGRNNARNYTIITIFLNCGLRVSELASLDVSQVNKNSLTIYGKGNKPRKVFLNEDCIKALENYLRTRNSDEEALFISERGTRLSVREIQNMITKLLDSIGLEGYTTHKLRSTCASILSQSGVSVQNIAKILGHNKIQTTMHYIKTQDEELIDAVSSLNFGKKPV